MKIKGKNVRDATKPLNLVVTDADCKATGRKTTEGCVGAVALCRQMNSPHALIGKAKSYYLDTKTDEYVRFNTEKDLHINALAYDRGGDFPVGEYTLTIPYKGSKLGDRDKFKERNSKKKKTKRKLTPKAPRSHKSRLDVRPNISFERATKKKAA